MKHLRQAVWSDPTLQEFSEEEIGEINDMIDDISEGNEEEDRLNEYYGED